MKKLLLSLAFLFILLISHSQVVLNEIYTDQSNTTSKQYFELYNTSDSSVNLDCYTVAVYYGAGATGFYVIDLPSLSIGPKSYFVGAAAGGSATSGGKTYTPDFNWNAGAAALTSISASFKKYDKNGLGYNVTDVTNTDFLATSVSNNKYAVFLFNNGKYENGFITSSSSDPVPFRQMPAMNNLTNGCGAYSITWANVTASEFNGAATGNSHGYYRGANGLCGTWDKITGNATSNPLVTPKAQNPKGTVTTAASGNLNSIEALVCGSTLVNFQIQTTAGVQFPIEVELYYDNNNNGLLEAGEFLRSKKNITTLPYSDTFNVQTGKTVVIVYQTALGCASKVATLTPSTGTLTTTEKNVCNNFIDYIVSGTSNGSPYYVLPVNVQLYVDANSNNLFDSGEEIGTPQTLTGFSSTPQRITIPTANKNQVISIAYTSATTCFSKVVASPTPSTGALTTTQDYFCNKRVNFTIPGGTAEAATYSLPIVVSIYNDVNGDGVLNEDTSDPALLLGQKTITSFSLLTNYIDLATNNWGKAIIVEYKAANDCFTRVLAPQKTSPGPIVLGGNIGFGASSTMPIVTCSVDLATASNAFPITLEVYEDANQNGQIDAGEKLLTTQNLTASSSYQVPLTAPKAYAILVATSTNACSQATAVITNAVIPLPVKLVSFNAKRNKEKVLLNWETTMEQNNSGFDVQRKLGNDEWKTVAFVFSQANGGNSSSVLHYEYPDNNPANAVTQYRLRQVDIDTRTTLSEIRSVRGMELSGKLLLVYPNPSEDGKLNVMFDERIGSRNISVGDITGRIVKQYHNITSSSLQISNLPNGVYTLSVTNEATGETTIEKVIIKKR